MSKVQVKRRYVSERNAWRHYEVTAVVTHPTMTAGALTEQAAADADRRAEAMGKELGDRFRLLNDMEGDGMEVIVHAE